MKIEIELDGREGLDAAAAAATCERVVTTLSTRLAIDLSTIPPIRVIIGDGESSAVDREVRVSPRPAGRGYTVQDWLELLVSHELTHVLVREAWGMPPVLWWEGIAIHLGDDRVRTRLFGTSYRAYCRALDDAGLLLAFEPLLRASAYYRRRGDPRVDLQSGSFCGFLLDIHGPGRLASFVADTRPPTAEPALAGIDPMLERHFGAGLDRLHADWRAYLRAESASTAALAERIRPRLESGIRDGYEHCDRCFARLASGSCACP
jgi:hypothetical protein